MKYDFLFWLSRIIAKLPWINEDEYLNNFFRKAGIEIGRECHIYSNIVPAEPFLLHIGNKVTISTGVTFCTHDNSIIKVDSSKANLFGYIYIGNNCFVGERALIMYGVTLADNIIVAAGSVVCNSFDEERIIIGGNPARKIGTWDSFYEKNKNKGMSKMEVKNRMKTSTEMFVVKKREPHMTQRN
ncbi:MAG: hypothetical protein LKI32_04620 [Lachnospiraceae bacterium]|jgi:acetyltransferase-like isoleucine patch superfamily enzyme|nr:hypothetical protein [Lachnospiraceae bacterium]MCI1656824.1 hypothetical protein [Lachnospiraceae bacterium]MCI2195170.1 hypothetical protein [Lachnospiraceae bacterium]